MFTVRLTGRYDYEQLFDSVLEASGIWAEQMSYDTRFAQQRELEKTQMQVGELNMKTISENHFIALPCTQK